MKVHYFQRYSKPENVVTANTVLLLHRLYNFSPSKFYEFINLLFEKEELELYFNTQTKGVGSIPDGEIFQDSWRILIETKLNNNFTSGQLINHLNAFDKRSCNNLLLTLDPCDMECDFEKKLKAEIKTFNSKTKCSTIVHKHVTFELLISMIDELLSEQDYEMKEILDDFNDYCIEAKLIDNSYKIMRVVSSKITYESDFRLSICYRSASRRVSIHNYLGLYDNKVVKAIGKIKAVFCVNFNTNDNLEYTLEIGKLSEKEIHDKVNVVIEDAEIKFGWDLKTTKLRYFLVEKFYETNFRKTSKGGLLGAKRFDLCDILGKKELPGIEVIAKDLYNKTW